MIALALGAGRLVQHVEVDDVLLAQPFLRLIDYYCLAFRQFDCHAAAGLFVKEVALALIQLLGHRSRHRVLVRMR